MEEIRAVLINDCADSFGPLLDELGRLGVTVVEFYVNSREVVEALRSGSFPQVDVILTELRVGESLPDVQGPDKAAVLVRKIREAGVDALIIVLATFANYQLGDGRELEELGVVVDPDRFRVSMLKAPALAANIREVLGR